MQENENEKKETIKALFSQQIDREKTKLEKEKERLEGKKKSFERLKYINTFLVVLFVFGFTPYTIYRRLLIDKPEAELYIILFVYLPALLAIFLLSFFQYNTRIKSTEDQIQEKEFEIDLLDLNSSPEERWAEKLLRINQYQLRRYYDLNLSQSRWIFAVGIICIFIGFAVIGVTLYFVENSSDTWQEKIVLGLIGVAGTLFTDYIAVIYLKMYSEIAGSLTASHSKLVSTHKSFLANVLVSRIADKKERWNALKGLALAIEKYGESPKVEK